MELPVCDDYTETRRGARSGMHSGYQATTRNTLLRARACGSRCICRLSKYTPLIQGLFHIAGQSRGSTAGCHQRCDDPSERGRSRTGNVREHRRQKGVVHGEYTGREDALRPCCEHAEEVRLVLVAVLPVY